jgi:menaquinol-cytochrome c reductase iron-sulfur subunit
LPFHAVFWNIPPFSSVKLTGPRLNSQKTPAPEKVVIPAKPAAEDASHRRDFLKKTLALAAGALAVTAPLFAGLMVLFDPLRRKSKAGAFLKVTTLASLPDDGVPRQFPVLSDRVDAWNKSRNVPIGAVYLRRTGGDKIEALNVVCPHAGCFVDYAADRREFLCPCHNSTFMLDGKIDDPKSPSPRPMDTLQAEVRGDGEIWVDFQNFQAGCKAKLPVA